MEIEQSEYGKVRFDPERDVLELEWLESSEDMTDDDFKRSLERFAGHAEDHRPTNVIVDVTRFLHRPSEEFGAWRDATIIPRYNAAGIARFAFLVPSGGAEPSAEPAPEGPANFPTGYFESRQMIDDWFAGRLEK